MLGTLQLDGQINAAGASVEDSHYGGGAGGSIWLQLGALTGNGGINAAGGWSGGPGGGGGGGRVAIYSRSFSGFETNHISVAGGYGGTFGGMGADGTIRLLLPGQIAPQLTLTRSNTQALISWPGFSGLRYQLLSTTNLTVPAWVPVGAPILGQVGQLSTNVPIATDPERFFRLEVSDP